MFSMWLKVSGAIMTKIGTVQRTSLPEKHKAANAE
jgi:hypothetical protein